MTKTYHIETIAGPMKIIYDGGFIVSSKFINGQDFKLNKNLDIVRADLNNFFYGANHNLTSKYKLIGTDFQIKVWLAIKKIPYGQTKTYSQIAETIGCPTACRAIANACGQNKVPPFIPCHRVVGKNNLGGYEFGVNMKSWLLELEKC